MSIFRAALIKVFRTAHERALDSNERAILTIRRSCTLRNISLQTNLVPEFQRRFDDYVKNHLRDADFPPVLNIDAIVHPSQINLRTAATFELLEPCGLDNPEPILGCRNVSCTAANVIGADKSHLSFAIVPENAES